MKYKMISIQCQHMAESELKPNQWTHVGKKWLHYCNFISRASEIKTKWLKDSCKQYHSDIKMIGLLLLLLWLLKMTGNKKIF
jgi:hypothetical protein